MPLRDKAGQHTRPAPSSWSHAHAVDLLNWKVRFESVDIGGHDPAVHERDGGVGEGVGARRGRDRVANVYLRRRSGVGGYGSDEGGRKAPEAGGEGNTSGDGVVAAWIGGDERQSG